MKTKKIIPVLIFILMISGIAGSAYAESSSTAKVVDDAGILTDEEFNEIETKLDEVSLANYTDFAVFFESTTPSEYYDNYGDDHVMYYCADLWDYGGYSDDGVVLMITVDDREWTIVTEGAGSVYFGDAIQADLSDAILPYLQADDFSGAALEYASFVTERMNSLNSSDSESESSTDSDYETPYTEDVSTFGIFMDSLRANFVKLIAVALVLGLIVAAIRNIKLKSELTSVRSQSAAADYIVPGSVNLRAQRDTFLYRDVTRTRKEKHEDNDSSFTSSSGDSHTGSHGSF